MPTTETESSEKKTSSPPPPDNETEKFSGSVKSHDVPESSYAAGGESGDDVLSSMSVGDDTPAAREGVKDIHPENNENKDRAKNEKDDDGEMGKAEDLQPAPLGFGEQTPTKSAEETFGSNPSKESPEKEADPEEATTTKGQGDSPGSRRRSPRTNKGKPEGTTSNNEETAQSPNEKDETREMNANEKQSSKEEKPETPATTARKRGAKSPREISSVDTNTDLSSRPEEEEQEQEEQEKKTPKKQQSPKRSPRKRQGSSSANENKQGASSSSSSSASSPKSRSKKARKEDDVEDASKPKSEVSSRSKNPSRKRGAHSESDERPEEADEDEATTTKRGGKRARKSDKDDDTPSPRGKIEPKSTAKKAQTKDSTSPPRAVNPRNEPIALLFDELSDLENRVKEKNRRFKIRTFHHAAEEIRRLKREIKDGASLVSGRTKIAGLGHDTGEIVQDFLDSGMKHSKKLSELRAMVKQDGGEED